MKMFFNSLNHSFNVLLSVLDRDCLRTDGAARAKVGLHSLCRVARDENTVKNTNIICFFARLTLSLSPF